MNSKDKANDFALRRALLVDAQQISREIDPNCQTILLDPLVKLMKEKSREHPILSSFYFAGGLQVHPYFLWNDRFAIGIAVLPEDSAKAGRPKQHPQQTEVLFVLDGKIRLNLKNEVNVEEKVLSAGDVFVIAKGSCHWIEPVKSTDAVYVFAKTRPLAEPREEDCEEPETIE
ncbi:cupin domain-containing protein [candidate division KSB1 bacterium]|nr:cupin domain-containing protein [candidate division KSB1 bacterium]